MRVVISLWKAKHFETDCLRVLFALSLYIVGLVLTLFCKGEKQVIYARRMRKSFRLPHIFPDKDKLLPIDLVLPL